MRWQEGSAFAIDPRDVPPGEWMCSDITCYPSRLLGLVQLWIDAGAARNLVCSVTFKGATDHGIMREFAAIPGSHLAHLGHNKHELTFVWRAVSSEADAVRLPDAAQR